MSVAHDQKRVMRVEKFTCVARRAITKVERDERKAHEKDDLLDGVHYYAVPHED